MNNYKPLKKEDAKKEVESFIKLKVNCPDDLRKLPSESGIYAVVDTSGEIIYIGKSVKLRSRWYAKNIEMIPEEHRKSFPARNQIYHSSNSIFWQAHKMLYHVLELGCHISYKLYPKLEAAHLELDLINSLKPAHNTCTT
jgi:hypothetical protein